MRSDVRFAMRALRRQPLLAAAIVFTVGLAVGGNTALFSVFDGLLFRPLPYAGTERLVHVELPGEVRRLMTLDDFRAIDAALQSTPLFDLRADARATVLLEDGAADVAAWNLRPAQISPSLLRQLGVAPAAGRLLTGDDRPVMVGGFGDGSPRRAMIGFDLWQTRFGGRSDVLGTPVEIPGVILRRPIEVVGVMPREFAFPDGANLWVAATDSRTFNIARLAPGVAIDQARAALPRVEITPFREHLRPEGAFALGMLLAATGCLLLIAWVQVAGLLFARAAARAGEVGVRLALGASRGQIVRQFAVEGAILAAAALALAWILTPALTSALVALLPDTLTRGQLLAPDLRAFGFSMLLSAAGVLVLAVVPAEIVRRSSPLALVRGTTLERVASGAGRTRLAMLAAQLAVTTTLLYMSALAVHSFEAIAGVDLGFDPDRVVAVQLPPTTVAGSTPAERRAHLDRQVAQWGETLDALRALPGIDAAAGGPMPFRSSILSGGAGMAVTSPDLPGQLVADYGVITPDYVRVLRLHVIDGVVPDERVLPGMGPQAVVNAAMAREIAPAGSAVGRQVTVNSRTATIAAVVADFRTARPDRPVDAAVLLLVRRPQGGYVLARLAPEAPMDATLAAIRTTTDRVWPTNPSREVLVVSEFSARAIAEYRARAVLLALVGALCLPLAFAGIAGAVSYAVSLRTREIGIRVALGAGPAQIRRTIARGGLAAIAAGLAAGLAAGAIAGRAMQAWLFGVSALDAVSIVAASIVLSAVALAAMALPARHALRVAPAEALRTP